MKMSTQSYQEWLTSYTEELGAVWKTEKPELRNLAMIYTAFVNELNKLKNNLHSDLCQLRLDVKNRDQRLKFKNFRGLAQSMKFDEDEVVAVTDKENDSPNSLMEIDLNKTQDNVFLEVPESVPLIFNKSPPPEQLQMKTNVTSESPILHKNSFTKNKRKTSTSPVELYFQSKSKVIKTPASQPEESNLTILVCDDSNIMESSIIEQTPDMTTMRKSSRVKQKQKNKPKAKKSNQKSTLTQMFFEAPKATKHIDSNLPSMSVTELINLINSSDSEEEQSDATVDDLEIPEEIQEKPKVCEREKTKAGAPQIPYEEVVRGKERQKLKGWSCRECQDYYEGLDLSPDELQKKKDQCSKHRYRFKPRPETFDGFWDLTFKPTPQESPESQSLILDYKH